MKTILKGFKKKAPHTWACLRSLGHQLSAGSYGFPSFACWVQHLFSVTSPRISYRLSKAVVTGKGRTFGGFCIGGPHSVWIRCNRWKHRVETRRLRFLLPFLFLTHWATLGKLLSFSETHFSQMFQYDFSAVQEYCCVRWWKCSLSALSDTVATCATEP